MLKNRIFVLACLLPSLAMAALGEQRQAGDVLKKMQANILIVESHDAIAKWALNPGSGDIGRMRKVLLGKKIYVPIVVTGINTANLGPDGISADLEFVAPDGKVLNTAKKCCAAKTRGDPRTPGLIVLNPVLDYESEPGDPLGTYELRATVTYGTQTASAIEKFEVIATPGMQEATAPASPVSGEPSARKLKRSSKSHTDARSCLDFKDNIAVMHCAEKYR